MAEPFKIKTGDPAFDPREMVTINGYHYIPGEYHLRRVDDLLLANNRYLERARAAEAKLSKPPAARAANAGGDHEVAAPTTEKAGTPSGSESGPGGYAEGGQN